MTDNHRHDPENDSPKPEPDGGTVGQAAQDHRDTDYLDQEVNILKPSTPFMRDHLRVVWMGFAIWVLVVFGPVTATYLATSTMTQQMPVLGFPLHYFLVALGAPSGALILSLWYARRRDRLDEKYDIEHTTAERAETAEEPTATDGGVDR